MSEGDAVQVEAWKCHSCHTLIDNTEGPAYECSGCGGVGIEENRCSSCNRFMAKLGDEVCSECHSPDIIPIQAWLAMGDLKETEEEAVRWIDGAPERERIARERAAKNAAEAEARMRKNALAAEQILPRIRSVIDLLNQQDHPKLLDSLQWNVESLEREGRYFSTCSASIQFTELVLLVVGHSAVPDLSVAADYSVPREDREEAEARLRIALIPRLHRGELKRLAGSDMYGNGCGLIMDVLDLIKGLYLEFPHLKKEDHRA